MDILSLVLACSINPAVNEKIYSISSIISQGNPLYIYDKNNKSNYKLTNEKDAKILLNSLDSYNAGIVAINDSIAQDYALSEMQILDACSNIKVASKVLTEMQKKCKLVADNDPYCALKSYGNYVGLENKYVQGIVINYSENLTKKTEEKVTNMQAERSSIFPDGTNNVEIYESGSDWSNNGLFINILESENNDMPSVSK